MMNFFKGIKERLSKEDAEPVYRQYTHGELKIIAMRTRMIFEDLYKRESVKITQADNQFKKVQSSQGTIQQQYEVLQQISKKVIETEMIKLYIEILRKIEAYAPQIMNTKGDVAFMRQQIKWFQCILWYRRCKKLNNIDQFDKFCWNFFKGVDITMQLNLKCELFKIYEGLQYLDDDLIVPLDFAVEKIIPHVSFQIGQQELDQMKKINGQEIRRKEEEEKRKKMEENPFYKLPVNNPPANPIPIPMPANNSQKIDGNMGHGFKQPQKKSDPIPLNPQPYIYQPASQQNTTKDYTKLATQDDQFAIDPYSRVHKPNPNKTFKSNDLNLIDWQGMYKKEQAEQQNPYVNSSNARLVDNDYSVCSEENSYDETTMPYPPSGVVAVDDLRKKDDFYIDTLPCYEPQPVKSEIRFIKKEKSEKSEDDSFIKGIENQFFSDKPYEKKFSSFNEQDLLKEGAGKKFEQKKPEGTKSLNKLFGLKFKSNFNQQSPANQQSPVEQNFVPYGSSSQNYSKDKQHKSSQIDDMLSELNNDSGNPINSVPNRFSVDEMLRDLSISEAQDKDNSKEPQIPKDKQHLDEDIRSLIEFHRIDLKKQSSQNSVDQYKRLEAQAQKDESEFTSFQYPDDCERFNDSKIKFSEEMQLLDQFKSRLKQDDKKQTLQEGNQTKSNPEIPQQFVQEHKITTETNQFDYSHLQKDLLDSLKIIKNHYGEDLPGQNETQDFEPMSKSIKKPYMVSIYARNEFLEGLKLNKNRSCK